MTFVNVVLYGVSLVVLYLVIRLAVGHAIEDADNRRRRRAFLDALDE